MAKTDAAGGEYDKPWLLSRNKGHCLTFISPVAIIQGSNVLKTPGYTYFKMPGQQIGLKAGG